MSTPPLTELAEQKLLAENAELRARLAEAEEMLRAIRRGEVDALVVESASGPQVYTLQGLDAEASRFRGEILAQVSDTVIVVDDNQRVTYLNAAAEQQYGVSAAEVLGRKLTEMYETRWFRPEDEDLASTALRETGHWRGENIHVKRNGETIHAESSVTALHAGNGTHPGLLMVVRDITQRMRAEASLREADRRKDEFLAMLSHELRSPLAGISNAVQVLRFTTGKAPNVELATDIIARQVGHLVRLVNDLLDVSRISRGKVQLQKNVFDLTEAVRHAIETSQPLIQTRRHTLNITLPTTPLLLEGDLTRLTQVISNLLDNAAKYTEESGHIWITVQRSNDGEYAVLSVRDTGRGIDASVLPSLFDLFFQADRNLDRSEGGLGIGLSLVRSLVEMHGGRVEASSSGKGAGSEFIVHLPCRNSQDQ